MARAATPAGNGRITGCRMCVIASNDRSPARLTGAALILLAVLLTPSARLGGAALADDAAATLRRAVTQHLREGRVDAALATAQQALARDPANEAVRQEFISLHLALARRMMSEEDFETADRALDAILKVAERHPEARRLAGRIESARRDVPTRVAEARRWLELEWFEPAFNTFRQAVALSPDLKDELAEDFRRAAVGAADDHYFCKNFHEAFYFYDAALKLGRGTDAELRGSLASRWMQSMVHALAADIDRIDYPPAYWRLALERAESAGPMGKQAPALRAMLRGLAHEDMGRPAEAAVEYGKASGLTRSQSRAEALRAIRRQYDVMLSQRRRGHWLRHEEGEWQTIDAGGFRIHHRNPPVGRMVAGALRFHFKRIADLLALDLREVPWNLPCDVYLHRSAEAFRAATRQGERVRAISVIRRRGAALESHTLHAHQQDPLLLSASLPHELAHLMIAAATRYAPMNPALSEGLALHTEPPCRHQQFTRLFGRIEKPRSIAALLKIQQSHPPETAFYAEAHRLLATLRSRRDLSIALELTGDKLDRRTLAKRFNFRSASALEEAYTRSEPSRRAGIRKRPPHKSEGPPGER